MSPDISISACPDGVAVVLRSRTYCETISGIHRDLAALGVPHTYLIDKNSSGFVLRLVIPESRQDRFAASVAPVHGSNAASTAAAH